LTKKSWGGPKGEKRQWMKGKKKMKLSIREDGNSPKSTIIEILGGGTVGGGSNQEKGGREKKGTGCYTRIRRKKKEREK